MEITEPNPEQELVIRNKDQVKSVVEGRLQHHYTNGIFVQDVWEASNGELVITLGNAFPKDVSDCRDRDNVLKYVNIGDVFELRGKPTNEKYIIELKDEEEVYERIEHRQQEVFDLLDWSIARAIYSKVYDLAPVRNQLNPILQILTWARNRKDGVTVGEIDDSQDSGQSIDYVEFLDQFGYIRLEDDTVFPGSKIESADMRQLGEEEYARRILGDVVRNGYRTLKNEMDLNILSHFPKYSASYYYSALQKNDPDLWLDLESIKENFREQYPKESKTPLYIEDRLTELARVKVLRKDGKFVSGRENIFREIHRESSIF